MKHIAAISVICLTLTTGSTPALGAVSPVESVSKSNNAITLSNFNNNAMRDIAMAKLAQSLENEANQIAFERKITLAKNAGKIKQTIKELKRHVGKTWYVFSGATPSGWDCSGLTMWFYEQLGIELEHRASRQDSSGIKTKNPKPGDLVVFHYTGNKDAYHVGIYIGNGKMIHAPKKGHLTRVDSVKSFGGDYSNITYRNFLESEMDS
jgi:cell wall-associated NlpC family hydrolase